MSPAVSILQWVQIVISSTTLAGIIFGVVKVINRNNEEWRERERRMAAIEQELAAIRQESKEIIAIGTQIAELRLEMTRVRDRLDRFLDMHGGAGMPK